MFYRFLSLDLEVQKHIQCNTLEQIKFLQQ